MTRKFARPRRLTRTQRRVLVTLHVALSVGWLGASMVMLTLAIAARASQPAGAARSAYWAMHLLADVLLIPLSLSVLLIGVLVAVISPWGLLRYRWVLVKLIATCAAVLLSLSALPAMTRIAYQDATQHALAATRDAGTRLIIASSASVALYLSLTAISFFKPWGRAIRGRRHTSRLAHPASLPGRSNARKAVTTGDGTGGLAAAVALHRRTVTAAAGSSTQPPSFRTPPILRGPSPRLTRPPFLC